MLRLRFIQNLARDFLRVSMKLFWLMNDRNEGLKLHVRSQFPLNMNLFVLKKDFVQTSS